LKELGIPSALSIKNASIMESNEDYSTKVHPVEFAFDKIHMKSNDDYSTG